jgi:hypothetical protein
MRKWIMGCGVVLAVLCVALVGIGVVTTAWFKKRFPDAKQFRVTQEELHKRYGAPEAFVPPVDGSLPADRLALFAALRDSVAARRQEAAPALAFIEDAKRKRPAGRTTIEKIGDKIGFLQGGFSLVSGVLDYFSYQQRLLRDAGMGPGEYRFYQSLTSYSWLGWNPLARPQDVEALRSMEILEDVEAETAAADSLLRQQLANAQHALATQPPQTDAARALATALDAELGVPAEAGRFPFAGHLPVGWAAALAPYRDRLLAALPQSPAEVPLEVMHPTVHEQGPRFEFGERHRKRGVRMSHREGW